MGEGRISKARGFLRPLVSSSQFLQRACLQSAKGAGNHTYGLQPLSKPIQTKVTLLHQRLIVPELRCIIGAGVKAGATAGAQILVH